MDSRVVAEAIERLKNTRRMKEYLGVLAALIVLALLLLVGRPESHDDSWVLSEPTVEDDSYVIVLSPKQREQYASATYTVICHDPKSNGYYPIVSSVPIEVDNAGRIVVPKNPLVIMMVDNKLGDETICPVTYVSGKGSSDVYKVDNLRLFYGGMYVNNNSWDDAEAQIVVNDKGEVTNYSIERLFETYPFGRHVSNTDMGMYRMASRVSNELLCKTHSEDGGIAPISDWEGLQISAFFACCCSDEFDFVTAPASGQDLDWFIQVSVKDIDGNSHGSELIEVGNEDSLVPEDQVVTKETDQGTLSFTLRDGEAILTSYEGTDEELHIPEEVNGVRVTKIGMAALRGNEYVHTIEFPDSVAAIGEHAFAYSSIRSFHVPPHLEYLDGTAFLGASGLVEFVQEQQGQFTSVRDGVLYSSDGTELLVYPPGKGTIFSIPDGVEKIGYAAFAESSVKHVDFPSSLKVIGPLAFSRCEYLEIPVLPDGLEQIGTLAFDCTRSWHYSVTDGMLPASKKSRVVNLGSNVSYIGKNAFSGLELDGIEVAPDNAWYKSKEGCLLSKDGILFEVPHNTGALVVPEGTTKLVAGVLSDFKGPQTGDTTEVVDVYVPASVKAIEEGALPTRGEFGDISDFGSTGNGAFLHVVKDSWAESYAKDNDIPYDYGKASGRYWRPVDVEQRKATLSFRVYSDHAVLMGLDADDAGHVVVPDEVEGVPVTVIGAGDNDMASGTVITLVLPKHMEAVEGKLLNELMYTKQFQLDASNETFTIREGSLCSADGKTLVAYPKGRGETYVVPDGIEVLGQECFKSASLKEVILPEGLKRIEEKAFASCNYLKRADLPQTVEYIGPHAFDSSGLETTTLNDGLRIIGKYAFNFTQLTEITIPDSVEQIGSHAFSLYESGTVALESRTIHLGTGLKELGDSVFDGIEFDSFDVSPDNECFSAKGPYLLSKDGKILYSCASTAGPELHIPEGVESIEYGALEMVTDLSDIYLPSTILRMSSVAMDLSMSEREEDDKLTIHCTPGTEGELVAQALAADGKYAVVADMVGPET